MGNNRVQAGIPSGGQFAASPRSPGDADLALEEPTSAPTPFPIGAPVNRLAWGTKEPVERGHILGPAQMTWDGPGTERYEVYPVQAEGGRGLAGWWTTENLVASDNHAPPKWQINEPGSVAQRFMSELPGTSAWYVEDTDQTEDTTDVILRAPGEIAAVKIGHGTFTINDIGRRNAIVAAGTYDPALSDGVAEASTTLATEWNEQRT